MRISSIRGKGKLTEFTLESLCHINKGNIALNYLNGIYRKFQIDVIFV
nr:MAG TPA: hypothetical protein [Caudoviricetes sp.]